MADDQTKNNEKSQENFVRGNRVYILGPFDRSISSGVVPDLLELIDMMEVTKDARIEFYINSHGGYAAELLSLISLIEMAKARGIKIITYNLGVAYSCGSILAVMGDYKFMSKYADNLPHLGQAFICPSTMEQLNRGVKHVTEWFQKILDIYAAHTKLSRKELSKILKDDDCHLNAEECLKYGFCDEII